MSVQNLAHLSELFSLPRSFHHVVDDRAMASISIKAPGECRDGQFPRLRHLSAPNASIPAPAKTSAAGSGTPLGGGTPFA